MALRNSAKRFRATVPLKYRSKTSSHSYIFISAPAFIYGFFMATGPKNISVSHAAVKPEKAAAAVFFIRGGKQRELCVYAVPAVYSGDLCEPEVLYQGISDTVSSGAEHGQPDRHRLLRIAHIWYICHLPDELRTGTGRYGAGASVLS